MPWAKNTPIEKIRKYNRNEMRKWRANRTPKQRSKQRKSDRDRRTTEKYDVLFHYTQVFDSAATKPHCNDPYHKHFPNDFFFTDIRILTIDHINGGGAKHRKQLGNSASRFYRWLIKHNYPEGYQVLCMNCEWIKRYENKEITQPQP